MRSFLLFLSLFGCAETHELPPRTTGALPSEVSAPLAIVRGADDLHWIGYDEALGGLAVTGRSSPATPLSWTRAAQPVVSADGSDRVGVHVVVAPDGREVLLFAAQLGESFRLGLWVPGAAPVFVGEWSLEPDRRGSLEVYGHSVEAPYVGLELRGGSELGGFVLDLSGGVERALLRPTEVIPVVARRTGDGTMNLVVKDFFGHGAYVLLQRDCAVEAESVVCGEVRGVRGHELDNGGRFALCRDRLVEEGQTLSLDLELLALGSDPRHLELVDDDTVQLLRLHPAEAFLGAGRPGLCATALVEEESSGSRFVVDVLLEGGRLRVERHLVMMQRLMSTVKTSHGLALLGTDAGGTMLIEGLRVR